MSTIYIVDDDPSIVTILKDILNKYFKGSLIGSSFNGEDAIEEIKMLKPNIVLLDFLLPDKDGLQVIKAIREEYDQGIIMISEVSDKQMIAKAYKKDIEFFISKPINVVEVVSVIKKVIEHLKIKGALSQFEDALSILKNNLGSEEKPAVRYEEKLKKLYNKLGIIGSSGCDELIKAVIWSKSQGSDYSLSDMYKALIDDGDGIQQIDAVKKRIGRVITKAFKSMASLGVEDSMNPLFEDYASQLFDFTEMRKEMRNITGESKQPGKIHVKQFIESSLVLIED
ncbi:response regulator [uncultured Ilyobacter sp.]|uniref:response regulator n=1 Tax=uncultured Ilyobacter sp. TaxID=544433 RepID=UPI002AA63F1B|nr:response regulator [uncultured Ilyobacter sp.]